MTDFCNITPTAYLDLFGNRSHHLTLAHLVEQDPTYAHWYSALRQNPYFDGSIIMDNSAFEMYKQERPMYPSEKLIEMGNRCGANYIVMTDYPNQPPKDTIEAAIKMAPELRAAGFGTFFVPQSEIGDLKGLLEAFEWASTAEEVDYIGVSILAVPNAYGVEKGNKLQRFLARWKFMQELEYTMFFQNCRKNDKKIHFLGMVDGPNEILLMKPWLSKIDTWDSSAAVWAGLNGIEFDTSPTGLVNGKYEPEVHFNHNNATPADLCRAMRNINFIDERFYDAEA